MSVAATIVALSLLAPQPATPLQDDQGLKKPAVLEGRFLLPDGTPAEGVHLSVMGWGANQERILEYGEPRNWNDPTGETDADGRFQIRFVPPRAYQFVLDAILEGYAETSWRWGEIKFGERKDLGDITLVPECTVVGRVVDRDGNTLTYGWRVTARTSIRRPGGSGRDATTVRASIDAKTGEFRLEGVLAGRARIRGGHYHGVYTNEVMVNAVAGKGNFVELVYGGPNLHRRISVRHSSHPFYSCEPASESIKIIATDGTERTAVHVEGSAQNMAFDELPEGVYRVEIDDPLYEFWSRDGVRPGDRVDAMLTGAGTLELEVVDGETGRQIPRYGLRVVFHEPNPSPIEYELLPDGSIPPLDGFFEGIIATNLRLIVRQNGRAVQQVEVEGLTRGERRSVRVELDRGTQLVGRVLDAAGAPLAGVQVERTTGTVAGVPKNVSEYGPSGPLPNLEETYHTDREGRFVVTGGAVGMQTFRVCLSPWLSVDRTVELPLDDGEVLELQTPPSGWLEGELTLPEGASTEGLSLTFWGEGVEELECADEGGSVEADGTFRYGPLPTNRLGVSANIHCALPGGGSDGHQQQLGFITIEPDSTKHKSWDLRETYPGSAYVTLRVDGDPFAEANLSFDLVHTELNGFFGEVFESGESGSHPEVDDNGVRARAGLAPGIWLVRISGPTNAWQWTSPDSIKIEAGRATDIELTLDLVRRRVRFVDATSGDPYSNGEVVAWTGARGSEASAMRSKTDDDGIVAFRLPPGEVRFCRTRPGTEPSDQRRGMEKEAGNSVAVEWKAADNDIVVSLPKREE